MNLIFEHGIWSFANAEIWVGIGLILFFGILVAAGVPKIAAKALDAKAVKIQADLDEGRPPARRGRGPAGPDPQRRRPRPRPRPPK